MVSRRVRLLNIYSNSAYLIISFFWALGGLRTTSWNCRLVILFEQLKKQSQNVIWSLRIWAFVIHVTFKKMSKIFWKREIFSWSSRKKEKRSEGIKWAGKFIQFSEQKKVTRLQMWQERKRNFWWCCRNVNNLFYLLIAHFHMFWQQNGGNQTCRFRSFGSCLNSARNWFSPREIVSLERKFDEICFIRLSSLPYR